MDHGHEDMLSREAAVEQVIKLRQSILANHDTETVALDNISGRALAEDIFADGDLPTHDHATMDGFAFDATDDYPLTVVADEVFPESEPSEIEQGEAVRIATGAPLPEGANAVLKREESTVEDGQLTGTTIDPGTYVYERGSNVAAGDRLFVAGERLSAKDAIFLGDLGIDRVSVATPFSAGILATGTEIHENEARDLDSSMLTGLIRSWGHDAIYQGSVSDDYDRVRDRIDQIAAKHDVVVTTGGTSVGHKDYVIKAFEDLGKVLFHRVRVRPGKPIAVAELPDATAFAIPGKPIGAHTIASLIMRQFFTGETHLATIPAMLSTDIALGPEGFEYVIPVVLDDETATPIGHVDSAVEVYEETFDPSVVSSTTRITRADGFVITESPLEAGTTVPVTPYPVVE